MLLNRGHRVTVWWVVVVSGCLCGCCGSAFPLKVARSAQTQWATFARSWYLIDARMQPPGKIASMCSVRLQGKHKPIYHALSDVGDHVVVMNTRHIAFSGNKWEQKVYSSHTG
ncbi:hypothetical protein AOLI_G00041560 [Acnodon oligacanthus]